jgi:hypothetical protein
MRIADRIEDARRSIQGDDGPPDWDWNEWVTAMTAAMGTVALTVGHATLGQNDLTTNEELREGLRRALAALIAPGMDFLEALGDEA